MYTPKGELNDKLVEAVTTKEVIDKITASSSLEEVYQVVKEAGCDVTMDELKNSLEILKAYNEEKESGVLSEEDLDQVAGGKNVTSSSIENGFDKVAEGIKKYSPIALITNFL